MNDVAPLIEWLGWWFWPLRVMSAWGSSPLPLAPQALSQPILPGWTFAGTVNVTEENSRSPETERQIVAEYSYGRQLGRVLDAVNQLIAERPDGAPDVPPIEDFKQLWSDIDEIKTQSAVKRVERALTDLARSSGDSL